METYLTPAQVCDLVPGMSKSNLAQLRFKGQGPKYLRPTPKTILYRRSDIIDWLEASECTSTASVA